MSRTCPECLTRYDDAIARCPEDGTDLSDVGPDDELIGRTVGSYRIVRQLGKGGMGAVYLAEHPLIGSRVAIKLLHPQYSADRRIVDRFFNEARAVNLIGHDNILKILDLDVTDDGRHYCIMEFLHGKSLQQLVKPGAPLPLAVAGPILLQLCEALQAAHDHHIVHRDLKPDNVYLTLHKGRKNFVKVVDFGIARLTDESGRSSGRTQTGMVMGTPAYMSPEQASGVPARIDGRSDVYSLGCLMFQLATGKLPFTGSSFADVLIAHLQAQPARPRELVPDLPEAWEAVILKCLEKKPEHRYPSMRELHDALLAVMESLGITRELPAADPEELAAAQAERPKTGPRPTVALRPRPRVPVAPPAPPETALLVTPPPARHLSPVATGFLAAVFVMVLGGGAFALYQQAERRAEEARREAAARRDAEARSDAATIDRRRRDTHVVLSIVSEPLGAHVEAAWDGGGGSGNTPFQLEVPKDTKLHLSLTREGWLPGSLDLVADATRVVKASLAEAPKVAVASPVPATRPPRPAKKKAKPAAQAAPDGTLPVEF